jgi:uncharacterized protein YgbK (DUF1537 family)
MSPRLGIVTDVITGCGDIGSLLAARGWAVRVFAAAALDDPWRVSGRLATTRTDAALIDIDSRFDLPDLASEKARRAREILASWSAERVYQKTGARFRGDDGAELDLAGLAAELTGVWPAPAPFDPLAGGGPGGGGALVVAGSHMPQSRAQIAALEQAGAEVAVLDTAGVLDDDAGTVARAADRAASALAGRRTAVLRSDISPEAIAAADALGAARGLDPIAVSRAVSSALAEAAARALAASATSSVVTLGGHTSAALCDRLHLDEMLILDPIEPGLPVSLAVGPPARLVVLKSGSTGSPGFVVSALRRLG